MIMRIPEAATPAPAAVPHPANATSATAAQATPLSIVTRVLSSLVVIEIPLGGFHRSKERHEASGNAQPEADHGQPRSRPQPAVRVIAGDEPNHGRQHQGHADRSQLADGLPGRLAARRHVNTDTSTSPPREQGSANHRFDELYRLGGRCCKTRRRPEARGDSRLMVAPSPSPAPPPAASHRSGARASPRPSSA